MVVDADAALEAHISALAPSGTSIRSSRPIRGITRVGRLIRKTRFRRAAAALERADRRHEPGRAAADDAAAGTALSGRLLPAPAGSHRLSLLRPSRVVPCAAITGDFATVMVLPPAVSPTIRGSFATVGGPPRHRLISKLWGLWPIQFPLSRPRHWRRALSVRAADEVPLARDRGFFPSRHCLYSRQACVSAGPTARSWRSLMRAFLRLAGPLAVLLALTACDTRSNAPRATISAVWRWRRQRDRPALSSCATSSGSIPTILPARLEYAELLRAAAIRAGPMASICAWSISTEAGRQRALADGAAGAGLPTAEAAAPPTARAGRSASGRSRRRWISATTRPGRGARHGAGRAGRQPTISRRIWC